MSLSPVFSLEHCTFPAAKVAAADKWWRWNNHSLELSLTARPWNEPQERFPAFFHHYSVYLKTHLFHDWKKNIWSYYFGNNVAQTRKEQFYESNKRKFNNPVTDNTWCLSTSYRKGRGVVGAGRGCTYLLPLWRQQRAIRQTNYEINNLEVQVCVSNCSFMAPSWTLSPCGDLLQLVCASAVSLIVLVTCASSLSGAGCADCCRCNDISGVRRKTHIRI